MFVWFVCTKTIIAYIWVICICICICLYIPTFTLEHVVFNNFSRWSYVPNSPFRNPKRCEVLWRIWSRSEWKLKMLGCALTVVSFGIMFLMKENNTRTHVFQRKLLFDFNKYLGGMFCSSFICRSGITTLGWPIWPGCQWPVAGFLVGDTWRSSKDSRSRTCAENSSIYIVRSKWYTLLGTNYSFQFCTFESIIFLFCLSIDPFQQQG